MELWGKKRNEDHLMLHGNRVPGHVDAFDWSERGEGLPDGVLAQLIVDGADVNATHDGQSSLPLSRHLEAHSKQTKKKKKKCEPAAECPLSAREDISIRTLLLLF